MASRLVPLYQMLLKSGLLKLDLISLWISGTAMLPGRQFESHIKNYKGHMKIGGYKMFLDGSPQGRTAWMRTPICRKHRKSRKEDRRMHPRTHGKQKEDYCGL